MGKEQGEILHYESELIAQLLRAFPLTLTQKRLKEADWRAEIEQARQKLNTSQAAGVIDRIEEGVSSLAEGRIWPAHLSAIQITFGGLPPNSRTLVGWMIAGEVGERGTNELQGAITRFQRKLKRAPGYPNLSLEKVVNLLP